VVNLQQRWRRAVQDLEERFKCKVVDNMVKFVQWSRVKVWRTGTWYGEDMKRIIIMSLKTMISEMIEIYRWW
jgi:hypothetical protein